MLFDFELSKLKFRVHNLMNFLIKWITDEAVSVVMQLLTVWVIVICKV